VVLVGLQGPKGLVQTIDTIIITSIKRDPWIWIWIMLQVNCMFLRFYCKTWMRSMEPPKGLMDIQGSWHHQVV